MDNSTEERPAKRVRLEENDGETKPAESPEEHKARQRAEQELKRQRLRDELNHPQPESAQHRRDRELFGIDDDNDKGLSLEPLQQEEKRELRKMHFPKMFSQPSVMSSGDKGIFVTCDKGREKKCLTDLADLVEEYLETNSLVPADLVDPSAMLKARVERQQEKTATVHVDNESSPEEDEEIDIESSVTAELSRLVSPDKADSSATGLPKTGPESVRLFQLITLDVPCVSFLRFIPGTEVHENVDVVDLVHTLCDDAARNPGRMRSRYIKRLSPVVWLGKILSDGLDRACEATLPAHFELSDETSGENSNDKNTSEDQNETKPNTSKTHSFAIRPTIRNNDKLPRDEVIKQVAEAVHRLGKGKHRVDLKGYQRCILVEVYRGWVGMSVVDNTATDNNNNYSNGYDALKKFNLAEIYAEGWRKKGGGNEDSLVAE